MCVFKLLRFSVRFHRDLDRAKAIKADPQRRRRSVSFGIASMLSAILAVAFSFAVIFGLRWIINGNLFRVVAGAVIGIIGAGGVLAGVYKAIECWGFQLYINKGAMSWISLLFWLLAIAAIVVLCILLI